MMALSLCSSSRFSFRFHNNLRIIFFPTIFRPLSTGTVDKRLKAIEDLPGPKNQLGIGLALNLIFAHLSTKKPIGKLLLEGQINDVATFGHIHKLNIPGATAISIADPVVVANILRSEPKYPRRTGSPVLDYYREIRKTIPGVFFADGEDWYRYRSTVSKRILIPREVAENVPVFNDIITDFMTRLDAIKIPAGSEDEHEVKHIDNELFKWSFESVAHVLFDRRFGCLGDEMNPEAQDFIKSVGGFLSVVVSVTFLPVSFYKIYETKIFKDFVFHFDNMYKYAELFISRKVKELEEKAQANQQVPPDNYAEKVGFLEYLLSNDKLSRDDLLASVIDLLFAGVDTTSNAMQWILYSMAKNQDKQEKLYQEVTLALQPGEVPRAETLAKMPYLKACLKETLRLYPLLIFTGRIIHKDMEVLGYHLPKGTELIFLNYCMSRSESNFKEANKFIPERWLRGEKREASETAQAFASIPFGFGTRMCAGRRLAELEIYLLVTRLLQKYKITYPDNEEVEPFMRGVTIPDRPVRVKFIERLHV